MAIKENADDKVGAGGDPHGSRAPCGAPANSLLTEAVRNFHVVLEVAEDRQCRRQRAQFPVTVGIALGLRRDAAHVRKRRRQQWPDRAIAA